MHDVGLVLEGDTPLLEHGVGLLDGVYAVVEHRIRTEVGTLRNAQVEAHTPAIEERHRLPWDLEEELHPENVAVEGNGSR